MLVTVLVTVRKLDMYTGALSGIDRALLKEIAVDPGR